MKHHPRQKIEDSKAGNIVWIMIIVITLFTLKCNGQISLQMRSGYAFKTKEPIVSAAIHFAAHGFALNPEMIVTWKDNSPAFFGVKISYQYKFIETGYGRYFTLYSTDYFDKFKNGWSNLFFVSAHYRKFFLEYDYINGSVVSIGFRETIGRLQ